ncbi:MAG TPA: response regulator [Kineosporiaceae bacterium]|nr:response regulator [Kineosporiaceae bacterium]
MGLRVLIVDDHEPFRRIAHRLLVAAAFDVVGEAADAAQALLLVEELRPDVVVLDVQLSGTDGFGVAEALSMRPAPPAVVLVSSRSRSDYGALITRSTARGFVAKADLTGPSLRAALMRDGSG